MATKTKVDENKVVTFPKEQILSAKKYSNRKDIVSALLSDDKQYSFEEVDALIEKFMKGKVN